MFAYQASLQKHAGQVDLSSPVVEKYAMNCGTSCYSGLVVEKYAINCRFAASFTLAIGRASQVGLVGWQILMPSPRLIRVQTMGSRP
mmetsp:Transcript_4990/g.13939  ORF Transcript_4990/g.13939 Transcript_4990/m.13939 type:complete len:87 (-) Transcript_4990:13-273(-)